MKKISIGLLTIICLAWAYIAYAQTSKETIEKRRIEKAIELGSGDFAVTDNLNVTGISSLDGAVTINESGNDVDFRVESDTNANGIFFDGTNGYSGFGIIPSYKFHVESSVSNDYVAKLGNTDATNGYGLFVQTNNTTASKYALHLYNGVTSLLLVGNDGNTTINSNVGIGGVPSTWHLEVIGTGAGAGIGIQNTTGSDYTSALYTSNTGYFAIRHDAGGSATSDRLLIDSSGKTELSVRTDSDCGIGNVCSGIYTPVGNGNINHTTGNITELPVTFSVVGYALTITGRVDVFPTAGGLAQTQIRLTIPSGFTLDNEYYDCGGSGTVQQAAGTAMDSAYVSTSSTTEFSLTWNAGSATSQALSFTATCQLAN
jgi:hypothetical protein